MELILEILVALGIFPSLTALSTKFQTTMPVLYSYTGPLNPSKLLLPFLSIYIFKNRNLLNSKLRLFLWAGLIAGTLSTVISGVRCHFPSALIREWFVIVTGVLTGTSFLIISHSSRLRIVKFWCLIVFGSAILDCIYPPASDWLFAHIFDPDTKIAAMDQSELGGWALNGIFGRQSIAKFMAWLPWLYWAVFAQNKKFINVFSSRFAVALTLLAAGSVFATSQRGPFIASLIGWLIFYFYRYLQLRKTKSLLHGLTVVIGICLITSLIVPKRILRPRLEALSFLFFNKIILGPLDAVNSTRAVEIKKTHEIQAATYNQNLRLKHVVFSWNIIKRAPFGDSCISGYEFILWGIFPPGHSHNIFLQQFRERGWVWGAFHFLAWVMAVIGFWKLRSDVGSVFFAGISCIIISGLFDHPWFVINQSMVLGVFLVGGLNSYFSKFTT